jgi:hypothetical protein
MRWLGFAWTVAGVSHKRLLWTPLAARTIKRGFEMFWFRLIVVGGFGLLGLVAAIASIAQGLHP